MWDLLLYCLEDENKGLILFQTLELSTGSPFTWLKRIDFCKENFLHAHKSPLVKNIGHGKDLAKEVYFAIESQREANGETQHPYY